MPNETLSKLLQQANNDKMPNNMKSSHIICMDNTMNSLAIPLHSIFKLYSKYIKSKNINSIINKYGYKQENKSAPLIVRARLIILY